MVQLYFAVMKQQGNGFTTWFPDLNVTVRGEEYEIFTKALNALRACALSGTITPPSDFVTLEGRPDVRGWLVDGGTLITVPLGDETSQQNVTKEDWTRDILNAGTRAYRLTPAELADINLVLEEKDTLVERLRLKHGRLFDETDLQRLLAECPIRQTTPYPRHFIAALEHFIHFSAPPSQEQMATFRQKKQKALPRKAPSINTSTNTSVMKVYFGVVKVHKKLDVHVASFPDMKDVTVTGTGDDVLKHAREAVTQWNRDHPTSMPLDVPTLLQRKDVQNSLANGGYLLPVTHRKDLVDLPADPQEFFFKETAERLSAEAQAYCISQPEIYFIEFIVSERDQLAERVGIKRRPDGAWSKAEIHSILAEAQRVWPTVLDDCDSRGDWDDTDIGHVLVEPEAWNDTLVRHELAARQGVDLYAIPRVHSVNFMTALKLRLAMVERMGWFNPGTPRAPETFM